MTRIKAVWLMAVVCLLAAPTALLAQKSDGLAPVQISQLVSEDIALGFGSRTISERQQAVISSSGASFIKIHFEYFNIPSGVSVIVSNPDGSEVYSYGQHSRDDFTHNEGLGQDGETSFSSLSITGDTAVVTLVKEGKRIKWDSKHGIYIGQYSEGFPEDIINELTGNHLTHDGPVNESTCGQMQRFDAACYQSSHPTEYDRSNAVARLVMGGGLCTAWRVGNDNRLFTNNHCMDTASAVAASEVWFNYQRTSCNGSSNASTTKVSGNTMLATDYTLDYTLFTVNNFANIQNFGNLGLDVRNATNGEEIYIPQHGSGDPKQLAIESDQNAGGICRVDSAITNGRGSNTDMGYNCDTIGGSSGSPVLARSSHKVIALHHLGGCENKGALINLIWPQVATHFGNVIPDGSGNTGGNNAPVANFSYTTSQLTANFSDASSDSDGSIASRSWNFGDGATSTSTNPSHTYGSAGTYTVTLTVTDNDGASNTSTKQVTVTSSNGDPYLANGASASGLSGSTGNWVYYRLAIPAGATGLSVSISGGSGDADLYTRAGARPTTSTYDCRPYRGGNSETCSASNPAAGDFYIGIRAYSTFSGVTVTASWTEPGGNNGGGFSETNLSGSTGQWRHYTLEVAGGSSSLSVELSSGSGDADVYVRYGSQPTTTSYDYRPYLNGNNETVNVSNPQAGTWHISIRAYRTYSGVDLTAAYE